MEQVLHLLNEAVTTYQKIPAGFWQALLASGVLVPLLNVYKKIHLTRREQQLTAEAMHVIVIAASFLVAFAQYMLTSHPNDPRIIFLHTAVLSFMTQPVYLGLVKPLWAWSANRFGNSELKRAVIPADGLPLAGTSVSTQPADFSS